MSISNMAERLNAHLWPRGRAKVSGLGFLCVSFDYGKHWRVLGCNIGERYLAWLDAGNKGTVDDMEEQP